MFKSCCSNNGVKSYCWVVINGAWPAMMNLDWRSQPVQRWSLIMAGYLCMAAAFATRYASNHTTLNQSYTRNSWVNGSPTGIPLNTPGVTLAVFPSPGEVMDKCIDHDASDMVPNDHG